MIKVPIQGFIQTEHKMVQENSKTKWQQCLQSPLFKHIALLSLTVFLLLGSLIVNQQQPEAYAAATPGAGKACQWHNVRVHDTLSTIAARSGTSIWTLAQANHIRNVNLIFVGQRLCIPYSVQHGQGRSARTFAAPSYGGVLSSGYVRWYDYNALEWSTQSQVTSLIRHAAAYYGVPARLLLAIAWQESGWTQHVIARDGGIGVMQIMPYTAMSINASSGIRRDPYKLSDNIYLGASYVRSLWYSFHGDTVKIISAYNQGGWAVIHRGIFNWSYVRSVLYLIYRFN